MAMLYTDDVQTETTLHKAHAILAAIVENMTDNDEALDARTIEPLEYRKGFTVTMPAQLSYYESTGTGTPMLDSLIAGHFAAQAQEWARTYPQRAPLGDCTDDESEFCEEAQEWADAACDDEWIYPRVEVTITDSGDVEFRACFTDEVNAPHGPEYSETLDAAAFLALDGTDLEALANRVAAAPYLSLIVKQNSGGMWHAWFGTANGETAYHSTGGHSTEAEARAAVERAMR